MWALWQKQNDMLYNKADYFWYGSMKKQFKRSSLKGHDKHGGITSANYYKVPNSGEEYFIIHWVDSYKELVKDDPLMSFLPIVRYPDGYGLIYFTGGTYKMVVFTPHFFQRYRERMAKENDEYNGLDVLALMERFIARNAIGSPTIEYKMRNGVEEAEWMITDGCVMLNMKEDHFIAKTFVRHDQMYDAQRDRHRYKERMSREEMEAFDKRETFNINIKTK